jgi:hypothetical protein
MICSFIREGRVGVEGICICALNLAVGDPDGTHKNDE